MLPQGEIRENIGKLADITLYQFAQIFYWIAIITVVISAIGITLGELGLYLDFLSVLVQNPSNGFFGNSLTLILNVISIVFLVVIFLIQNANQNYSNRLASVIFTDPYFIGSILFVATASLFNISGSYFEWESPLTTLSFAFSIASIEIVISLICLSGYFVDISNIISYITAKYKQEVDSNKLYKIGWGGILLPDKNQISQLTTDVRLISSTCIKAIDENNHALVDTCLNSLEEIIGKYLKETNADDVNDDLLQDLNDEFDFIRSAVFSEHSRQKYGEELAESVGKIGMMITSARELGTPGGIWASLLKRIFDDSVNFERNAVGPKVIDKLGDMCVLSISKEDFDSFGLYLKELTKISQTCIEEDHIYFNNLIQNVGQEFQACYLAFVNILCESGAISDYHMEEMINTYANVILNSKSEVSSYSREALFTSIQNPTQPFSAKLAGTFLHHSHLDRQVQDKLGSYLLLFFDFLEAIGEDIDTNERTIYKIYTGILYSIIQFAPLRNNLKHKLVLVLNEKWVGLVSKSYRFNIDRGENIDMDLNRRMSDFYAIVIYFYRHDPNALSDLITPILKEYVGLKQNFSKDRSSYERNRKRLYRELKLIGAWIDNICGIENVSPELKEILIIDFYEVDDSMTRLPVRGLKKYDYPTNMFDFRNGWWLRPDPVWSNQFQENISELMNGENSRHYEEFHEKLEAHYKIRKATTTATILNDKIS